MKLDNKELLERLSTSRKAFNATAFSELDRNLSDDEREEWKRNLCFLLVPFAAAEYGDWLGEHSVSDRR